MSAVGVVQKVIGVDGDRRSRVHDRRGQRVPLSQLLPVPIYVAHRILGKQPTTPWMAPGAVRELNRLLKPQMRLLELGSGVSTCWYAERVAQVVSVEPNPVWLEAIESMSLPNVEMRGGTVAGSVRDVGSDFDVVIVDHNDEADCSRVDAVRQVSEFARIVVLDDSDRSEYAEAETILKSFTRRRFVGYRPRPLQPTETTIWLR